MLLVEPDEAFFVLFADGTLAEHGCEAENEGAGDSEGLEGEGKVELVGWRDVHFGFLVDWVDGSRPRWKRGHEGGEEDGKERDWKKSWRAELYRDDVWV